MSGRPGYVQVALGWMAGGVPPESAAGIDRKRQQREVAERLAASSDAAPAFEWPPFGELDPATVEAVAAWQEGLPMFVAGPAIEFEADVPLLLDHLGAPIAEDLEIGVRGSRFTATGWVAEAFRDELAARTFCSPGQRVERAEIVDTPGLRYVRVTRARLVEVSAVADPMLRDTFCMVGRPGELRWSPPTGERYTRTTPATHIDWPRLPTAHAPERFSAA